MIYLIRSEIEVNEYMSDNGSYIEDMRLVQADSMVEASDKYEKFWNDQSQDYVRTYNVGCQQISEMIV